MRYLSNKSICCHPLIDHTRTKTGDLALSYLGDRPRSTDSPGTLAPKVHRPCSKASPICSIVPYWDVCQDSPRILLGCLRLVQLEFFLLNLRIWTAIPKRLPEIWKGLDGVDCEQT